MKIQADLHTHTIASTHAYSTIIENAKEASKNGLKAIAMTDHAPMMEDAPHIWHFENLGILPRTIDDVIIIRGAEVSIIDYNGSVDLYDGLLSRLEWIVASIHGPCYTSGSVEENTRAYMKACENPFIDVFGHPTTNEFPWDYEKGLKAIKEYDKIIEINENSIRIRKGAYENTVEILRLCKSMEIPVVVDTDAHFCQQIGVTPVSEKLITEVDFPKKLILNLEWENIKERILKKHPDALE
ncbi:MAG: phosphatase [Oscillospiraceae bacterium]